MPKVPDCEGKMCWCDGIEAEPYPCSRCKVNLMHYFVEGYDDDGGPTLGPSCEKCG